MCTQQQLDRITGRDRNAHAQCAGEEEETILRCPAELAREGQDGILLPQALAHARTYKATFTGLSEFTDCSAASMSLNAFSPS